MSLTSITDVSIIINSKIGQLRDITHHTIDEMEVWLNDIINQSKKESLVRKDRCEVCKSKEDYFEGHHIAGRKHDFRQLTTCKSCHDELSLKQKLRDERWSKHDQSEFVKESFFLHGLYDVLILKSKKSGNSIYEQYALFLIEDISKGLK